MSPNRPEFFLDRGLGRGVGDGLISAGWVVHRIVDHFPDDAQRVPDEDWLAFGLDRGWVPLSKDGRIRSRDHERAPLERFAVPLFHLDNQQLRIAEMVARFERARGAIDRAVTRGGAAIYAVRANGIRRTWP